MHREQWKFFQINVNEDNNIMGLRGTSVWLSNDPVRHNEAERNVTLVAVFVGEREKKTTHKPLGSWGDF